jgi:deoxyribodipyrimidine photolyase-related protein
MGKNTTQHDRTAVLILGDQLTPQIAALRGLDPAKTVIIMAEVMEEASYVRHHKKKIAFLFAAMRHFAAELREAGWFVVYVRLEDAANTQNLLGEVRRAIAVHGASRLRVTEPGEWRLVDAMSAWPEKLKLPVDIVPDDRFFCSRERFAAWAGGRKQLRMEFFYREMREAAGLLMCDGEPEGGRWNFDSENRKRAPANLALPDVPRFEPDDTTREVLAMVAKRFDRHPGTLEPFWFGVTRAEARRAFAQFLKAALPHFGDFQDAMLSRSRFMFHAVIAQYLNCGLLDAREVCTAAEAEYRAGRAPLNAVEGFIRQILGWREYVRGVYWLKMPGYARMNVLNADRPLPEFYWTGRTEMACLRACITQTLEEAYAHHIQRLMVTGTFALLVGVNPYELHEWYLAVYADAYEWVEMPNTLGMSQYADGGLLASKPYAASGNYINKMSDYCKGCAYDVAEKTGAKACPFNYLYWDFIARNRSSLATNPRLATVYRTYDAMTAERRKSVAASAAAFLSAL